MTSANESDHIDFVVDGLNVCLYRRESPSLPLLLTLLLELTRRGHSFVCLFDASTRFKLTQDDASAYAQLVKLLPRYCHEITGGIRADDFILLRADRHGSRIITNDRFKDYIHRYVWVTERDRLVKGDWILNDLEVPDLDIHVPVLGDSAQCIRDLEGAINASGASGRGPTPRTQSKFARYRERVRRAAMLDSRDP